ncbi:hypothetical protein D9758_014532 [Tetrapyrgos nigripes]|uniref:Uncharacterized protein n=1 Tax=Tetrapyrgos nigripes TaxID=182062 RepID=A0A8H5CTC4_9AGAR|nr:hypothetical protein D9758_014532 [Tetrapyrgos nigripes]
MTQATGPPSPIPTTVKGISLCKSMQIRRSTSIVLRILGIHMKVDTGTTDIWLQISSLASPQAPPHTSASSQPSLYDVRTIIFSLSTQSRDSQRKTKATKPYYIDDPGARSLVDFQHKLVDSRLGQSEAIV